MGVTNVQCENCKRLGPDVIVDPCHGGEVRKHSNLKYYHIKSRSMFIHLCSSCRSYLLEKKKRPRDYWPAMLYSFLSHKNAPDTLSVPVHKRVNLLPRSWRDWWEHEFGDFMIDDTNAFRDVSKELEEANDALERNEWRVLARMIDKHLAYPEIRCPFGCSEFLTKTKQVPLEDFLLFFSNYQMPSYCRPVGKAWMDCISPSFPSSCLILEKFECYPAVVMSEDGPMILSCREHGKHSTDRYIHIPESPTGTIHSPNCNGVAPVTICPRTSRNFKVGGYNGVDSSFVTSASSWRKNDSLSSLRDALSIYGRPDIKAQLIGRSFDVTESNFLPERTIDEMVAFAESTYASQWPLQEARSSTYVSLECAVQLSEKIKGEASKTIKVYNESGAFECKLFNPPWPTFFVHVHSTDGYGERFEGVALKQELGKWMLLCMCGRVADLWEAISDAVEDNRAWNGHWLRYASSQLRYRGGRTKCSYFPEKDSEFIRNLFPVPLDVLLKSQSQTKSLFRACANVLVVEGTIPDDETLKNEYKEKKIIICVNPVAALQNHSSDLVELRCLLSLAMMDLIMKRGVIAIFCCNKRYSTVDIQRRYMNVIGGQNSVFCGVHKCPLVLNHEKKKAGNYFHGCICSGGSEAVVPSETELFSESTERCASYGTFVCPKFKECRTAICTSHQRKARGRCLKAADGTIMFLSANAATYSRHDAFDEGLVHGTHRMCGNCRHESLGPTAAHEIPADTLEQEEADDEEDVQTLEDQDSDDDANDEHRAGAEIHYPMEEEMERITANGNFASFGTGPDDIMADTFQRSDDFNTDGMPCSRSGSEPLPVLFEKTDRSPVHMNLYVIFNQHGNVLTRSRSKSAMTKTHRALCEKIVSTSSSKVVPLVYAEAQLFPSIFWDSMEDGSIPGALPTALWSDQAFLKRLGIASLRSHCKNRITNPRLLSSVDPSYQFMCMDLLINLAARKKDTRIILHRGFADSQGSDGIKFREKSDGAELYGEASENHANVHKLSALVRDRHPHFFLTQSCNQMTCRGLHILRKWVVSDEARLLLQRKYSLKWGEASTFLRESAASYVLRSWNEVADVWMRYIIYSPEKPLGEIEYAWYRKEFQEVQGNPSHIHGILRTVCDISDPKQLEFLLKKIRGCIRDLVQEDEYERMQELGILSSTDQLLHLLEQAKTYLTHTCHERCMIPRRDAGGRVTYICKVADNSLRSSRPFQHTLKTVQVNHTEAAKIIYNRLGMMEGNEVLEQCLISQFHIPISSRMDRKFSPTNGHLFACYPSSQNIQYTTGHTISQYLVKYVAGLDEVAIVVFHPKRSEVREHAPARIESLHNTKITSNKILADKKKKMKPNRGRILTQMECLTVVLGAPLVTSTVKFVYIPTSPREYRAAFFKSGSKKGLRLPDHIDPNKVIGQDIRRNKGFPAGRLFSTFQAMVIQDDQKSPLTVCAVTVFSVRPPELRFVNNVFLYFKWFDRIALPFADGLKDLEKELNKRLSRDIDECQWIDGLNMQVLLRRGAIGEIVKYIEHECSTELFGNLAAKRRTQRLFLQIQKLYEQFEGQPLSTSRRQRTNATSRWQYDRICARFLVGSESTKLPTVWTTAVYPKNRSRFLVHILLLFGRFETEYELMKQGSLKHAYIHAGLLHTGSMEVQKQSLDCLLKRYVRECLAFQAGSILLHDNNLVFAEAAFYGLLDDDRSSNQTASIGTPCVLQSHIESETTENARAERRNLLRTFISTLFDDLKRAGFKQHMLPVKEEVLSLCVEGHSSLQTYVGYTFPPEYDPDSRQGVLSYNEQRKILLKAKAEIDLFRNHKVHKNIIICGGPGNGKTTVSQEICLYAFSRGLNGMATSIVADRSKALGGAHIHLLTALQSTDRYNVSPGRAAETAIAALYRRPELFYFWQRLEFLYIDEFGVFSAEMLATIDIIVRHVKQSSTYMGGLLIFATMDVCQLLPFTGTALMLSMSIMNDFNFVELTESVRAANDVNLRRICKLSRTIEWTAAKKAEFKTLIKQNCRFVPSFDSDLLPDDGIYVFGRKAPCAKAEELMLRRIRETHGEEIVVSHAQDQESSYAGNWKQASAPVRKELSRKLKRKEDLHLFRNGRYEFTYNLREHFQQGQLAILLDINKDDVVHHRPLKFFKGPPGCKEFPLFEDFTEDRLRDLGWEPVMVPWDQSKPTPVWNNLVGRREQYGVRLRVACTIHASMGSTFGKLITAVCSSSQYPDLDFTLWEAAQVVVLISRTRRCEDLYFIGSPDDVAESLLSVLTTSTRYLPHIRSLTQLLCNEDRTTPLLAPLPQFRPNDIVLEPIPVVYLLVSTRNYGSMYIGETDNIRRRLHQHNSGIGSDYTSREDLLPWALFGYVYGFSNRSERLRFESFWKRSASANSNAHRRTPPGLMQLAHGLASLKNRHRPDGRKLRIQVCGQMEA